jgi:prevent-host-death family protein
MDQTISAADANRRFSRILRNVRDGQTFVVTAHGKPVARIAWKRDGLYDR